MMLQVAVVHPGSSTNAATSYRRAAIVLGAVIVAHLLLLAIALSARNRIVERPASSVFTVGTNSSRHSLNPCYRLFRSNRLTAAHFGIFDVSISSGQDSHL